MVNLIKQNFKENKRLYKKVEVQLKRVLKKEYPINHVGSTAIPNMYGKNIIDILIGAKNTKEFEDITNILIKTGYFESKKSKDNNYRFFSSTDKETGSGDIHIHLVIMDSKRYRDFIILKSYLLSNKVEVKKYSDFKKEIIKKTINREEYKKIKSEYVTNLLLRAKEFIKL